MSDTSKALLERAKAAYRQLSRQIKAGNLAQAHQLLEELSGLQESDFNYPIAAVHLIFGYLKAGNLAQAQKLFEALSQLGDTREMLQLRTEVAHNLMIGYIHEHNLTQARKLLENMADVPETAQLRDEAAHNLIIAYLYAGDFCEAQKLFESMAAPTTAPARPKERWGEYSRSFFSVFQNSRLSKTREE